jgi:ATP-dependent DNA helicase RecQ
MWPAGMAALGIGLSGRIPADEQAASGRAVARVTDLGWGEQVRELFRDQTADGEVPVPLRHAIADVVRAWELDSAPEVVVAMGSRTRPLLVGHLADGMCRFLGLPMAATFTVTGDAPPHAGQANSAQRLRAVAGRYTLDTPGAVAGRSVLLVDDRSETGWTLAVAARELRRAGAVAVHPLVLAAG